MPEKLCECGCGEPAPIAQKTCKTRGYVKGQACRFLPGHSTRRMDLAGQTFGNVTVVRRDGYTSDSKPLWLVRCSHGTLFHASGGNLKKRRSDRCRLSGCPFCPQGHDTRLVGTWSRGACKACTSERAREWFREHPEYAREKWASTSSTDKLLKQLQDNWNRRDRNSRKYEEEFYGA